MIRVLVAVADPECRSALRDVLPPAADFSVTEVPDPREALKALGRRRHEVAVVELDLLEAGDASPGEVATAYSRDLPVVLLASAEQEARALRALQRGCRDYLLKDRLHADLVRRSLRYAVEQSRADRRQRRAEAALADSEQRYRSLFEQSRDAIYMTERSGEIVELNKAALEMLGYEADELIGEDVRLIYADPGDRERFQREIEARGHLKEFEVELRRRDGETRWCLITSWIRRDASGEILGYQGIVHDISARKEVEEQLAHEAFHDALTGLPNRALFMDRLERAIARRRRGEERELAVMFMDLDRFKVVNDSLGHTVGDELLRQMARLLEEEVREEDTVARIGGDEFAILLDGVDDPSDPTHVAERIQERLRKPIRLRGHDVFTSLSIGITFGGEVEKPEDMLRDADIAMYRAKEMGPARYQIFDEAMHAHAVTLLQLETDLRLALDRNEFVVHYQPVFDLDGDRISGFEALIRWQHPSRGLLQPPSFIPIAEDTGLIVPIGEWVLRTAVSQLRAWHDRDAAHRDLFMSVNLSARQFAHADLVETVQNVLSDSGLPPACLRLEVTETAVMQDPTAAVQSLNRMRQLGVQLCIDDFGTGYSSLNYLHHFPIDILKIDRTFISRLEEEDNGDLVETILALARNMGMVAVAEGVETERQLTRLRQLGPASVQGFLFSSALDAEAASAVLDQGLPVRK